MNFKNKIRTFLREIWFFGKKKKYEKEIMRDLEMLYEVYKDVYNHNCYKRNIITKFYSGTEGLFLKPEEVLNFELYFSLNEEMIFKKIGLDIDAIIRKFEKEKYDTFLVLKEYALAKYSQEYKKIMTGDRVLKYSIYSQVYRRSFKFQDKEPYLENSKKEINFFDYYESKN